MSRTKNFLSLFILIFGTIGCSYVPDWVNPVKIYKDASAWVTYPQNIEDVGNKKFIHKVPGSDKNFPKLASVPSRPVGLSRINRARILNSLVLDRKKSKETESKIKSSLKTKEVLEEKTNFLNTKSLERGQKPLLIHSGKKNVMIPLPVPKLPKNRKTKGALKTKPKILSSKLLESGQKSLPNNSKNKNVFLSSIPYLAKKAELNKTDQKILNFIQKGQTVRPLKGKSIKQLTQMVESATHATISEIGISKRGSFINSDIIIGTLFFSENSAHLTDFHRKKIERIVLKFIGKKGNFHIIGHANGGARNFPQAGHEMTNLSPSDELARIVSRELIRQGISKSLVRVTGVSDSKLVYTKVLPLGKAGNRRVEILFEKK